MSKAPRFLPSALGIVVSAWVTYAAAQPPPDAPPQPAQPSDAPPTPPPPGAEPAAHPPEAVAPQTSESTPKEETMVEAKKGKSEQKKKEEEHSPLVPEAEIERMKDHPVDQSKVRYRPGKGLEVSSKDGDYTLLMRLRGQLQYEIERPNAEGEETTQSFQIRRARLLFTGNVFGKHNRYKVELALSPRDASVRNGVVGQTPLIDWYMTFDYLKWANFQIGQYKIPFNRQRVVSSGALEFVDRSSVNAEFTLDRDIGMDVRSKDLLNKRLRYYAGIYIGGGRGAFEQEKVGFNYLGRIEVLPLGDFDDYQEGDFERTGPRLAIGGAAAYIQDARGNQGILGAHPKDGGTTDTTHLNADILYRMYGLSIASEVHWRKGKRHPGDEKDEKTGMPIPVEKPRDGYGFFVQTTYMIPKTLLQPGFRFSMIRPVGDSGLKASNELGGGLSYYIAQHAYKIQADYFRLFGNDGIAKGDDRVRVQLEAGF